MNHSAVYSCCYSSVVIENTFKEMAHVNYFDTKWKGERKPHPMLVRTTPWSHRLYEKEQLIFLCVCLCVYVVVCV